MPVDYGLLVQDYHWQARLSSIHMLRISRIGNYWNLELEEAKKVVYKKEYLTATVQEGKEQAYRLVLNFLKLREKQNGDAVVTLSNALDERL